MNKALSEVLEALRRKDQYISARPLRGGASGAGLFLAQAGCGTTMVLKVAELCRQTDSLETELSLYGWLAGKVPVPGILGHGLTNGPGGMPIEYLLMDLLPGSDLKRLASHYDARELVGLYARSLRLLHQLPVAGCPVRVTPEDKLAQARRNLLEGQVDEADFEGANRGEPADRLMQRLDLGLQTPEDPVFCHGDYCLDNLLASADDEGSLRLSGFIDLGMGGVQDRYQDLALAVRSVRKRFGGRFVPQFFAEYGLVPEISKEKIAYYIVMDEFF